VTRDSREIQDKKVPQANKEELDLLVAQEYLVLKEKL
jgi:hypothetical protein